MPLSIPTPGTVWHHYNGNVYTVLCVTNTAETNTNQDKYPPQQVTHRAQWKYLESHFS